MTRFRCRFVCGLLLAVLSAGSLLAQNTKGGPAPAPPGLPPPIKTGAPSGQLPSPGPLPAPDYETLKGLASQLGGQQGGPIDPELLELARQYLKNNPDFLRSAQFQQMKQQFQSDPNIASKLQNSGISPQDLQKFKPLIPQNAGGTGPNPQQYLPPQQNTGGQNQNGGPQQNNGGQTPNTGRQPDPATATTATPPTGTGNFRPNDRTSSPVNGSQQFNPNNTTPSAQELAQKNQDFNNVVGMWESNFGSLDNTPALKQSLVEMFSGNGQSPFGGMNGGNGLNGLNGNGSGNGQQGSFWNNGNSANNSGSGFGNWLKNMTSNGGPSWWKSMTSNTSGKSWFGGGSGWTAPRPPAGGVGSVGGVGAVGVGGIGGLGTVGTVVLLLVVAAVVGFILFRYWPQIQAMRDKPKPIAGLGEWPIDPRDVKDRETLVRAFEYLSVLVCGGGAVVWNHVTIADAMRANVPGAAPFADDLARLYALARYTPAGEPISAADIAAARGYLCRLAGVQA